MAALTANRSAPEPDSPRHGVTAVTVLDTEKIYAGGMTATDANGEIQAAADTLGLKVNGISEKYVDNTDDGETLTPTQSIRLYGNSSSYPVARMNIGDVVYVEDDQTVGLSSTNLVAAGICYDVTDDGVFVDQSSRALALAVRNAAAKVVAKTDDFTVTAAQCHQGNVVLEMNGAAKTFTLPTAVSGYRLGFVRTDATAGDDVSIAAATGDTVLGSAAAKKVDNTVDAVSQVLWLRTVNATAWVEGSPHASDLGSWVINDA